MNKIRIIDLLNKIANGEEVPKKFKYEDLIITRDKLGSYIDDDGDMFTDSILTDFSNLNDEVEIIEEKKKIPKRIQSNGENLYSEYIGQWLINKENYTEYDELLMNKINEIIDYLDYLKSKGE